MKLIHISKTLATTGLAALALTATATLFAVSGHSQSPKPAIYTPNGDVEAKAQAALDKNCARCHQAGKLAGGREKPAKNFGNILQLDQLLLDASRTKPGNADGSRIFQLIVNKEMPYDVYQDGNPDAPSPSAADIEALRAWLDGAKQTSTEACYKGDGTYKSAYDRISKDLGSLPDHRRSGARYITLTNLALNCTDPHELEVFRQATSKLLNSLSDSSDPLVLATIDDEKTILRFNLEDLGWTPEVWELIASQYPYGLRPTGSAYDFVAQGTNTKIPLVRGDWLAFTASRPPLYNAILRLPATFQELQILLSVDVTKNISDFVAKRAGFQKSGVSRNNRMIERHAISTGALWTSYDFAGNSGRQSLFEFPLGPGGDFGFHHDGGETIFNLPNGYQAYYLNKATGEALNKGPTAIVQDLSRKDLQVTNGISCMGCHDHGMRNARDEIRAQVEKVKVFPVSVREAVKALHPTNDEMDKVIEGDRTRFQDALKRSGVDPDTNLNKVEMINALSDRYERELDLKSAAAEFGIPTEELEKSMTMAGSVGALLVTRLQQGTVQRDEFETAFGGLVESIIDSQFIPPYETPQAVPVAKVTPTDHGAGIGLELFADKSHYAVGDKPVFTVTSSKDCHLTLVNVDPKGDAVVIFPNKFQQDNAIKANTSFSFPNSGSNFDFKLSNHGTESVIAICDESGTALSGVTHDYAAEAFTELGQGKVATRKIDVVSKTPKQVGQALGRTAVKIEVD
jgi:mono/diheme cytochrome c family protein